MWGVGFTLPFEGDSVALRVDDVGITLHDSFTLHVEGAIFTLRVEGLGSRGEGRKGISTPIKTCFAATW